MKIHIVMHESFESPGAIAKWAQDKGAQVAYTKLYNREIFPENIEFDFLIVMGGPQSPATTLDECPHFDYQKEVNFIRKTIDQNKIVFGVCLGAQMIGEALGAKFSHSPSREIGIFELTLTNDGKQDPFIGEFPEKFMVAHWHGDMPGLTPDSKILAFSDGCPRQIVRYAPKIYGFQCHFEFTPDAIEAMIKNNSHELEQFYAMPYIETAEQLRSHDYSTMNQMLFSFLDKLTPSV